MIFNAKDHRCLSGLQYPSVVSSNEKAGPDRFPRGCPWWCRRRCVLILSLCGRRYISFLCLHCRSFFNTLQQFLLWNNLKSLNVALKKCFTTLLQNLTYVRFIPLNSGHRSESVHRLWDFIEHVSGSDEGSLGASRSSKNSVSFFKNFLSLFVWIATAMLLHGNAKWYFRIPLPLGGTRPCIACL